MILNIGNIVPIEWPPELDRVANERQSFVMKLTKMLCKSKKHIYIFLFLVHIHTLTNQKRLVESMWLKWKLKKKKKKIENITLARKGFLFTHHQMFFGEMAELVESAFLLRRWSLKRGSEGSNPSFSAMIFLSKYSNHYLCGSCIFFSCAISFSLIVF